ncbi:MAG: hypothetical protein MI802_03100 [Desulfobacterales bacterium]|nr:hypothetical protein [Desulfobacterales bacterium]
MLHLSLRHRASLRATLFAGASEMRIDKGLSAFCIRKLQRFKDKIIWLGSICFLGTLVVYIFLFRELSLFPESLILSFVQGVILVITIPAAACLFFYKNWVEGRIRQIHHWNSADIRRASDLVEYFETIRDKNRTVTPSVDPVIATGSDAGEWKVVSVEFGQVRQNLLLLLNGMAISHASNYAGFGFGTILGQKTGSGGATPKVSHNIEGILTLSNRVTRMTVLLPGPGADVQWLTQMHAALLGAALVPGGCHTHELLKSTSFKAFSSPEPYRSGLEHILRDQAMAEENEKLSVQVRGIRVLDGFAIATQVSVGGLPPVSLYQTGFFDLFTEKVRSLNLVPHIHLPDDVEYKGRR